MAPHRALNNPYSTTDMLYLQTTFPIIRHFSGNFVLQYDFYQGPVMIPMSN